MSKCLNLSTKIIEKYSKKILAQFIYERMRNSFYKIGLKFSLSIIYEEKLIDDGGPRPELEEYNVGLLTEADMPEVAAINGYDYSSEDLVTRLSDGSICVGLRCKNKIVSFTWCDMVNRCHNILPIQLSEEEAFLYDAYTANEYRGRNLITVVRHQIYKESEKFGRSKFLSTSDIFNAPAKRFKQKLGAVPIHLVLYICLFNKIEKILALKNYRY